ncbi:MAG: 3-methyladenine DNA glycosylase [Rothia sp. (in: high G+C Gram-positive bacteria)]|uniref:DNA-3-methyladenine glycosylase family protein n=1 Tax=Rothia sp. (in: high G+C Gram-positive bacteria) TaxID=1885016 RepID=UPI0026E07C42|nr:3-methyladenine DNA glycosylase [Rothia sp. (in: high G+C Gram-positive bacteria)]MDO5751123.1 3-methyladenine DNA glycosylase [Rothia sp. (in: high G+C Gram-positive bacteria)]
MAYPPPTPGVECTLAAHPAHTLASGRLRTGLRVEFTPLLPVSLTETLMPIRRGPADRTMHFSQQGGVENIWCTARLPMSSDASSELAVTLHFERSTPSLLSPIRVDLWVNLSPAAAAEQVPILMALTKLAEAMPAWCGQADSWTSLLDSRAWAQAPRALHEAARSHPGLRLGASGQLMRHAYTAVLEQRVTQKEAFATLRAIAETHGEPAPLSADSAQPPLLVFPANRSWGAIPSWQWHAWNVDSSRYRTIGILAARADALERIAAEESVSATAQALATIPGVGPWTIAETLQRFCGHPDALSVGDYHLAHHVGWALSGERTDDAGILALLAPYVGSRQRLVRLIRAAHLGAPRRGAKITIEDHHRH